MTARLKSVSVGGPTTARLRELRDLLLASGSRMSQEDLCFVAADINAWLNRLKTLPRP